MKSRREQVNEAIRNNRDFHKLGREALPRPSHKESYGKHLMDWEAADRGTSPENLRKARQFAESYSRRELQELCKYCRAKQSKMDPTLPVFSRTHVIRLVSVPVKRERLQLQYQTIGNAWSTAQLDAEIAKRFGRRRQGGRRRRVPLGKTDLLTQLDGVCESWRRLYNRISQPAVEEGDKHASLDALTPGIRRQVIKASREVLRLQEAVTTALAQTRSL